MIFFIQIDREHSMPPKNLRRRIRRRRPDPQIIVQLAIVIQKIRARRAIAHSPTSSRKPRLLPIVDLQEIDSAKPNLLSRGDVAAVPDCIGRDRVLFPTYSNMIAIVEGEDEMVCHIRDAGTAVGSG